MSVIVRSEHGGRLARFERQIGLNTVTVAAFAIAVALGFVLPLTIDQPGLLLLPLASVLAVAVLFKYPEVSLALYLFAGLVKGDPYLATVLPLDLTISMAGILILYCSAKLIRSPRSAYLPREYLLYVPIVLLVVGSLFYTPDLAIGADKATRFILLTGLAICAPFVVLDSERRLRRFLYSIAVTGFAISAISLKSLGGTERFTAPSGLTIQLGTAAGVTIAIIWSLILPNLSLRRRVFTYPIIAIPFLSLIGSGARGAAIGCVCCVLLALILHRQLIIDAVFLGLASVFGLALISLPAASYEYLQTLITESPGEVLSLRKDLMALGWQLFHEHPFLGVGIGGYPYYSPNPLTYGWPHNMFLELAAELGVVALAAFTALVGLAFYRGIMQLLDCTFPLRATSCAIVTTLFFYFIQMNKSGDMNDNRSLWLFLGLPFIADHLADTMTRGN